MSNGGSVRVRGFWEGFGREKGRRLTWGWGERGGSGDRGRNGGGFGGCHGRVVEKLC